MVTLVTGASAGLGAEFARICAARGESVALCARRGERLRTLAAEIGGDAHVFEADLARPGAAGALLAAIEAEGLSVGTLVNNAGFGGFGRFVDRPIERQLEMIDLNVRTLVELCHLVLPSMRDRGRGGILNVASTAAFQSGPGSAVYFATKAFVLSFTEALHEEVRGSGIRVSCLCPGPTATEFGEVAGFAGRQLDRFSADAHAVAKAGIAGLDRNRALVIPGFTNKIGAQATRVLPRAAMRKIIASLRF